MTKAISIYDVVKAIIRERNWYHVFLEQPPYGEDVMTFREFSNIMIFNRITTYNRKISELYQTMIDTRLARKSNKDSIIINLDMMHEILSKYGAITQEDVAWAMKMKLESVNASESGKGVA